MKITIHSTEKIVSLADPGMRGTALKARVWEGVTESGIPVHCFVTRIAPTIPRNDPRQSEFQQQLQECQPPTAEIAAYPLKMIL